MKPIYRVSALALTAVLSCVAYAASESASTGSTPKQERAACGAAHAEHRHGEHCRMHEAMNDADKHRGAIDLHRDEMKKRKHEHKGMHRGGGNGDCHGMHKRA
jgi:hypothetical protein